MRAGVTLRHLARNPAPRGQLRGGIATLAGSATGENAAIRKPWGLSPAYLGLMLSDFDRPGEEAWLLGFSYDFKHLGIPGLSAFANFARGTSARDDSSGDSLPNQHEFDLTVDYHMPDGRLEGFWIRLLYGFLDVDGDADPACDYRVILNYQIRIL